MKRIVVCLRWRGQASMAPTVEPTASFERVLPELERRRAAVGARIVGWHARSLAFDFAADDIPAALDLLLPPEALQLGAFGVGLAIGELEVQHEAGSSVALALGSAIDRATAFAWIAEPGDVLVDPDLEAASAGSLLTNGTTLGTVGTQRLRGLKLDLRHPWRQADSVHCSVPAQLVGPSPGDLSVEPGQLSLVVAPRGCGGSRFVREVARTHPGAALVVMPWRVGEPLGGLANAFERASDAPAGSLPQPEAMARRSLLAGEGLRVESAAALVRAWLGSSGAVLLDDAAEIDQDTIEVLAIACRLHQVPLVARVLDQAHLPSALSDLRRAGVVFLGALDPEEAEQVVTTCMADDLAPEAGVRWARRGGGRPLAILEAVRFGIESGELVSERDSVVPRNRVAGRGGAQPARHWLMCRLRLLDSAARDVLDALLVLGGRAAAEAIQALLSDLGITADVSQEVPTLTEGGWVEGDASSWTLTSATLRDVLYEQLEPDRRVAWYASAARLLAVDVRPLSAARAALYAYLSDGDQLPELSERAAASAERIGLDATAEAFRHLATTGDVGLLVARGLTGGLSPRRPSRAAPRSIHPDSGVEEAPVTGRAAAALKRGDLAAVGELAAQLRRGPKELLAERLEAMACLRQGQVMDALRILRAGKERAQGADAAERCRAALAYGVALAAAGRPTESLLEALEALARAREVGDSPGERATARFIAQLSEAAGHHEYARSWRALAG